MKKIFTLFVAMLLCIGTIFAEQVKIGDLLYNLDAASGTAELVGIERGIISAQDQTISDWDALPSEYVFESTCPENALWDGLKKIRVYADNEYINFILVYDPSKYVKHRPVDAMHIFMDADNDSNTGGYFDLYADADADLMFEGSLFDDQGVAINYNPSVNEWSGDVNGEGWEWTVILGYIKAESQFIGDNIIEGRLKKSSIPWSYWKDQFGIGFALSQDWDMAEVGFLPQGNSPDGELIGRTNKLKVTFAPTPSSLSGDLTIPSSVEYNGVQYSVTRIGEKAFYGCSNVTSVTLPNSVTYVGAYAFYGCSLSTHVMNDKVFAYMPPSITGKYKIPYGIESIAGGAFYGSSLSLICIPRSVKYVGEDAFASTNANTVYYDTTVGYYIFTNGDAENDIIYINLNTLDNIVYKCWEYTYTVYGVSASSYIWSTERQCVAALQQVMSRQNNIQCTYKQASVYDEESCYALAEASQTSTRKRTSEAPQWRLTAYIGDDKDLTLPNSVQGSSYSIGSNAFRGNTVLRSVSIPNNVTGINAYAFFGCTNLSSISLPNSVEYIEQRAFGACTNLTFASIGNGVTNIETQAFAECRLEEIVFGSNLKVIGSYAFAGNGTYGSNDNDFKCSIKTITCYSMRPPTVAENAFYLMPYKTIVYVPADYLTYYQVHDAWGLYDVRPLGATSEETDKVKVEPSANTADVVWPAVDGAYTYELVIKDKQGNVICTLIFNANGQLTSIAFSAPARDNSTQASGFSFTVTGLEEGTTYDLTITAKDSNGQTLQTTSQTFTTEGVTGVAQITNNHSQMPNKVLRNGQLFILRGDKTYTIQGQEVR